MRLTIFGTGYVGLVQAAVFADAGHHVACVDINAERVAMLKAGRVPIFEPGLEEMVVSNAAAGRLLFTTDAREGMQRSELHFIAVGTPPDEDGSADLSHVLAVARTIADLMDGEQVIVIKSTVPVGTSARVRQAIAERLSARGRGELRFEVASNPEFLKEGSAVADCSKPDRIVIGVSSPRAEQLLRDVYAPFNRNHEKIVVMDERSSELTKYAANCMLATKISFMNEIANIADLVGADIEKVRLGIGSDPRIGYHFIYPGVGYGGSCFPKDVKALVRIAEQVGFEPAVLQSVELRNERQKHVLVDKMLAHYAGDIAGKTIALWGLAFKPNTDDMREAPSRVILEALWAAGARVRAFDPKAMEETTRIYGTRDDLTLCDDPDDALEGADALAVVTEWKEFRAPDFAFIASKLKDRVLFDGRNIYDPAALARHGLASYGIGRRGAPPRA